MNFHHLLLVDIRTDRWLFGTSLDFSSIFDVFQHNHHLGGSQNHKGSYFTGGFFQSPHPVGVSSICRNVELFLVFQQKEPLSKEILAGEVPRIAPFYRTEICNFRDENFPGQPCQGGWLVGRRKVFTSNSSSLNPYEKDVSTIRYTSRPPTKKNMNDWIEVNVLVAYIFFQISNWGQIQVWFKCPSCLLAKWHILSSASSASFLLSSASQGHRRPFFSTPKHLWFFIIRHLQMPVKYIHFWRFVVFLISHILAFFYFQPFLQRSYRGVITNPNY